MNRPLLLTAAAVFCAAMAQAQLTPESFMDQLGHLPSANDFVDCIAGDNCDAIDAKLSQIDKLNEQAQAITRRGYTSTANQMLNQKVGGTNVSAADLQKMTPEQQRAFGQQMANAQLSKMGVSAADAKKIQSGQMSEEQLGNQIALSQSGYTMQELQAMQNKTCSIQYFETSAGRNKEFGTINAIKRLSL